MGHPESANSMAMSGLCGRKVLVGTGRAILYGFFPTSLVDLNTSQFVEAVPCEGTGSDRDVLGLRSPSAGRLEELQKDREHS